MARVRISPVDMRQGDIVHHYGMRILLDSEPRFYETREAGLVASWDGNVTNAAEVPAHIVPQSFMRGGRYGIQGNVCALYDVERDDS